MKNLVMYSVLCISLIGTCSVIGQEVDDVNYLRSEISRQQVLAAELLAFVEVLKTLRKIDPDILNTLLDKDMGSGEKLKKLAIGDRTGKRPVPPRRVPVAQSKHLALVELGSDQRLSSVVLSDGKSSVKILKGDTQKFLGRSYTLLSVIEKGDVLLVSLKVSGVTKAVSLSYSRS